jgi:hypothetical protein
MPPFEGIFDEAAFREGRKKQQRRLSGPGAFCNRTPYHIPGVDYSEKEIAEREQALPTRDGAGHP